MHKATISIALLGISLILLIIYGADVLSASIVSSEGARGKGFLPFEEQVRGIFFGGGAVIISITAFIVGRKVPAKTIPILLFINGGLIIIGIIVTVFQANLSPEDIGDMGRTIGFTVILGLLLIGLGIWKIISDRMVISKQQQPPS
jgi:hypothetical protein